MFENVLAAALDSVPELHGKVYQLAAARGKSPPFAVYGKAKEEELEDLDGGTGIWSATAELHLLAPDYNSLKQLEAEARNAVKAASGTLGDDAEILSMRMMTTETEEFLANTAWSHAQYAVSVTWREAVSNGGPADD